MQLLQDPLKVGKKQIQEWAVVKLHPAFNSSFAECGMPFDSSTATLTGAAPACLLFEATLR